MKQLAKFRGAVLAAFVVGVIGSVLAVIPVTTAAAVPPPAFDCSSWQSTLTKAHARCNLGLGGVRVWADCSPLSGGVPIRKYGPVVPVGSISTVTCFSGTIVANNGYQTQ